MFKIILIPVKSYKKWKVRKNTVLQNNFVIVKIWKGRLLLRQKIHRCQRAQIRCFQICHYILPYPTFSIFLVKQSTGLSLADTLFTNNLTKNQLFITFIINCLSYKLLNKKYCYSMSLYYVTFRVRKSDFYFFVN